MPAPKRLRWFQYSLRTLLLVVLLASIGMSWVAVRVQGARRQKAAVEAIKKLGGWVIYDWEFDQSGNVEHLKRLSQLGVLSLDGTQVTGAGVKKLRQALPYCLIIHPNPNSRTSAWPSALNDLTETKT